MLNNLIRKTSTKNTSKEKGRLPDFLRCFILLIIGLPILEAEEFQVSFSNASYQRELSNKKFIVRFFNRRPIVSVILYILTVSAGILYAISTIWYVVENEIDPNIKNNLLKDSLGTILCLTWVSLGVFSINVLYNIFCR